MGADVRNYFLVTVATLLTACGGGGGTSPPVTPAPPAACDDATEYCGSIPALADACNDLQYWPLSVSSTLRPVTVRYPRLHNEDKATEVIALLEASWNTQVDTLGFTAPISDQGLCGADGDYDVFIWPGTGGAFVDGISNNPATSYQDWSTYMGIDPTGPTGGALLNTFIAHEFNHALQASDDWAEEGQHYEAGASFAEALVYPEDRDWVFTQEDFQDNPGWSLFYDDKLATWYSYGSAMYLHYLYERFFPNDPAFYARIWRGTRSDTANGRPDYIDALRRLLLMERGVALDDAVVEFMQWRWFVGSQDDGAHFSRGGTWPHEVAVIDIDIAALPTTQVLDAMIYGANYVRLNNSGATAVDVSATLFQTDLEVDWRAFAVDGGELLAPLGIEAGGSAVIVAVPLPVAETWTENLSFIDRTADLNLSVIP